MRAIFYMGVGFMFAMYLHEIGKEPDFVKWVEKSTDTIEVVSQKLE